MALWAWEEVRLSTLNKIFIRRSLITMRKNHIVKRGVFVVKVAPVWTTLSECRRFKSYENAYSFFRLRCNSWGWNWGYIQYHSFADTAPVLIAYVDREF